MDALVEAARGQVLSVGREGHTVHGLRVLGESVDVQTALHVPETHCRVERRAAQHTAGGGSERYRRSYDSWTLKMMQGILFDE